MIFLHPDFFYLIFLLLIVFIFLFFSSKSKIDKFYSKEVLKKIKIKDGSIGQKGRNILLFLALVCMIVALARPVLPKGTIQIKNSSIDLLVGIDVSRSMLAKDIYPNRLEFAKKRVINLMNNFKRARFGAIAFSNVGFLVSPLSEDTSSVEYLVRNLNINSINQHGTSFMVPLELAKRFLKNEKEKILVLFTDGGDSSNFSKEIKFAKENNIKVYVYAIGTKKGTVIEDQNGILKDKKGNIVIVRLNESIKKLALQSGGAYIVGSYSGDSIKKLEKSITEKIKETKNIKKSIKLYKELFYYPLFASLILMLFGFSSLPKNRKNILAIALFSLFVTNIPVHASILDFQTIKKATKFYQSKKYKKSETLYKKLLKNGQNSPELKYDFANTLYKQKKYKEALKEYNQIKTNNKNIKFDTYYNKGNAYAYLKQYDKAIKSYEKALKIKDDPDAKANLKLIKKLEKKKKKQQQNKKNNKKKNNKKNNNKKKNNKKNNKKNKQNNGKDKKQNNNRNNHPNNNKKNKQNKTNNHNNKKKNTQKQNKKEQNKSKNFNKSKQYAKINNKIMSDNEEKEWTRMLMSKRGKTLPLELKTKNIINNNGEDW